jgi:hypothetical protein
MISNDDIEALGPDIAIADKVVERAKKGATRFRHVRDQEEMPLLRAYVLWRQLAMNLWEEYQINRQNTEDAMGCFDRDNNKTS